MSQETLQAWLERAAGERHRGLHLLDRDLAETFLPWQAVVERAAAVAGGLSALGVAPGERVALVYPTSPGFFDAFFGALLAGAVPVPLYPPVRLGRLAEYHERTARMIAAVGAPLVLASGAVRRILGETMARARPRLGCRLLAELPAATAEPHRARPDEMALVQFSSGTTVEPKPVALSQRAVCAQTLILNGLWPDRPEVVQSGCSWLPLYHDMGLIGCVFPALERVADLTLLPPEQFIGRPALWLQALSRSRATISPAPNFAYALAAERVREEELVGVDLSAWRVALNGAETVVPEVLRRFAARFAPYGFRAEALTPVYGLSEAALAVTFSELGRPFRSARFARAPLAERGEAQPAADGLEIVSVGRPLPGFSLALLDEEGRAVGERRVGRIWVRGPSLMTGYLGQAEATARALVDGWLDTGDLGFLCDDELYLTGRAKDLLLIRGRNHSPAEVEQAVDALPGVRRGCVAAVSFLPEDGETERLVLLVERRERAAAETLAALPAAARRAVLAATGLAVDEFHLLAPGTLPRTSSGKIRRGEALRLLRAGALAPPAKVTPVRLAAALVRSQLAHRRARRPRRG